MLETAPKKLKLLYTIDEVAEALSVSRTTVRLMMARGYLPGQKIGRLIRFKIRDVEAVAKIDLPNLDLRDRPWPSEREQAEKEEEAPRNGSNAQ